MCACSIRFSALRAEQSVSDVGLVKRRPPVMVAVSSMGVGMPPRNWAGTRQMHGVGDR